MVLEVDRESILRTLHRDECHGSLIQYATQLALLGEIDAARDLISLRNRTQITALDRKGLGALDWAWRETERWPEGVDDSLKSESRFDELREQYETQYWARVPIDKQRFDEVGLRECLRPDREETQYNGANADAKTGWAAMLKSQRLVKALDISVRLMRDGIGDDVTVLDNEGTEGEGSTFPVDEAASNDWISVARLDDRSMDIAKQVVSRWHANRQIQDLLLAERLWPLYITGVLAKAMGLSRGGLDQKKELILSVFSERLAKKHLPPVLTGRPIKELLEIAQENTWLKFRKDNSNFDEPADPDTWTLFKDGASEDQISDLETRLAITLPADYKEFLRITNGFNDDDLGLYNGLDVDPGPWDTTRVDWVRDRQQPAEFLQLPREIEELGEFETKKSPDNHSLEWDTALPLFNRVIEIGAQDVENIFLVPPECVEQAKAAYEVMMQRADDEGKAIILDAMERLAGSKEAFGKIEWCCCTLSDMTDLQTYSSFRSYLEHAASKSMQTPKLDES